METDLTDERQQAHALLDMLPQEKLTAVRSLLEVMVEPLSRSLSSAPVEEEEITSETAAAIDRARAWRVAKAFLTKTSCASSAWVNDRTPSSPAHRRHLVARGPLIRENVKFLINLADTANDASERLRRHFDSCSACKG